MPSSKLKKFFPHRDTSEGSSATDVSPARARDTSQAVPTTSDVATPVYSDGMKEAWAAAHKELPQVQGTEKVLSKIVREDYACFLSSTDLCREAHVQDALTLSPGEQTVLSTLTTPAKALMDTPQVAEMIRKGVNTFMETVPSLIKVLDEVAKVHPFIGVAVLAFKAVYTLETTRRENDKRVLALYAEMKDMMEALVQLNGVSDLKQTGPDGQTIERQIGTLCEAAAGEIKKCANACDAYLKKKILVKIFAGPIWEGRLLDFVGVFTQRRQKFEFAMAINTTVGVGVANLKLDAVNERSAELNVKVEIMLQMFREFITPQQKQLTAMVQEMGGEEAVLENDQAMEQLEGVESSFSTRPIPKSRRGGDNSFDLASFRQEIEADPNEAIEKNAKSFNQKFDIQTRQIVEGVRRALDRTGDRVIEAVKAGPHDRIVDRDIYNIWKDMGWRGSVEARHFVMTLSGYYIEKASEDPDSLVDSWATKYINIGRAQNILEAFDDDASGFVTTNEVNAFTRSRPSGWSLPRWIAWWAIGLRITSTMYCEKIEEMFDAMVPLYYESLPENRDRAGNYIYDVWKTLAVFVRSVKREKGTDELRSKFESHVAAEEARLRRNFEGIKYRIDGPDEIRLISEHGRLETTLFPMMYLAMKRHFDMINLARKYVISRDEFEDARTLMDSIADVALDRIESLKGIFEQQNLKPKEQFKIFSGGLYDICSEYGIDFFYHERFQEVLDPFPVRNEMIPDPDSIPLSILNHPLGKRHEIDFSAYDPPKLTLSPVEGTHPVLGVYYGFIYLNRYTISEPMLKFALDRGEGEHTFVGAGSFYQIASCGYVDYKISGGWGPPSEDGKTPVMLNMTFGASTSRWNNMDLRGVFDPEENSLRGIATFPDSRGEKDAAEVVFKRDPDFVRWYPAPATIDGRKRWRFATRSVLDRFRRQTWSPKRISKRIKDGKRYMELVLGQHHGKNLNGDELDEFLDLVPGIYEADATFYASLMNINLINTTIFTNVDLCDNCHFIPGGSRIICLDCHEHVSLCSEPECVNSTFKLIRAPDREPHLLTHRVFKIRRFIFDAESPRVARAARDAIYDVQYRWAIPRPGDGKPMQECACCKTTVTLPCWYCIECTGDMFICDDCEHKDLALNDIHTALHRVARVPEEVKVKERSTVERLQFLEDELAKMKQMLERLVERSTEGFRDESLTNGNPPGGGDGS